MARDEVRLGIVGCGNIVSGHLHGLRLLRQHGVDNFRVTALCDQEAARAESYQRRGSGPPQRLPKGLPWDESPVYVSDFQDDVSARVFSDWRDMVAAGLVDAVFVLTPIFLHHEIAGACVGAGVDVLLEKPLAISVLAAQRLIEDAARHGATLGVAESIRYEETTRAQRFAIESGYLGRVHIWMSALMGAQGDAVFDGTPWRHSRRYAGGGFALDAGVHRFHQVRYLCGEIEEISAMVSRTEQRRVLRDASRGAVETVDSELDDAYFANLKLRNGAIGSVVEGLAGHGGATALPGIPTIYGSAGCLMGESVISADGDVRNCRKLLAEEATDAQKAAWFPLGITDRFALEQLDFLRSVTTRGQMETSADEGLKDLACSFAVLESATWGAPVRIEDVLSGHVGEYQSGINQHLGIG